MSLDYSAQTTADDINQNSKSQIIRHSSTSKAPTEIQRQMSSSPSFANAPVSAISAYLKHLFGLNAKTTKRSLSEEAECGSPESLEEWLRQGSNPNELDAYGYTPLVNASLRGCVKSAKVLLGNGADINKKAMHGYSALHAAAQNGFSELVELLIDNGADLEIKNDDGDSPLMLAVRSEHASVVDLLCKRGCNMHTHGFDNVEPIEYAINKRNLYLSDILIQHERQFSTQMSGSGLNAELSTVPASQNISLKKSSNDDDFNSNASLTALIHQQQDEHNRLNDLKPQSNDPVFQSD